jgi:hypothetical protein
MFRSMVLDMVGSVVFRVSFGMALFNYRCEVGQDYDRIQTDCQERVSLSRPSSTPCAETCSRVESSYAEVSMGSNLQKISSAKNIPHIKYSEENAPLFTNNLLGVFLQNLKLLHAASEVLTV